MTDGTNPVIEPCPFCGEQLENHLGSEFRAQWFHPLDGDCVLMGQGIENVAAWNTRAIPSANPVIVERVRDAIENALLAADVAGESYGSKAARITQAALEAMSDVRELVELRAERDALLQKPIDLAKMDSVDDDATDKMIAYYWHQQAQDARADVVGLREALTPNAETKAAYHGEFRFDIMVRALDPDEDELVPMTVSVPWTTIKEIMAAIRDRAALAKVSGVSK